MINPTCTATRHDPTESGYTHWRCRCDGARIASITARRNRHNGIHIAPFIDVTPTANRLRILAGAGYGWQATGRHIGWCRSTVRHLAIDTHPIRPATAAAVANTFNNLVTQPQPYGYAASKAVGVATRNGWGYVDLHAVHRTLDPTVTTLPALTEYERYAVIYTGRRHGHTISYLAELVGMNTTRVRKLLGEERPTRG